MLVMINREVQKMATVQIATRVDEQQSRKFRELTQALGTTPSDALRMFIAAFNSEGGFPYDLKVKQSIEAFDNEDEATYFATRISRRIIDEAR
jgi:DNA-damage-inducible protein J